MSGVRTEGDAVTTRARTLRRRLLRAALCVLLGAVTTVGVAWWDKWVYDTRSYDGTGCLVPDHVEAGSRWGFRLVNRIGHVRVVQLVLLSSADDGGPAQSRSKQSAEPVRPAWATLPPPAGLMTETYGLGRPMVALTGVNEGSPGARGWLRIGDHRLPVRPYIPGFLVDTLVYALPCWILLAAPGFARGWLRRRRNRCVACGYDLRGLGDVAACPECGQTKQRAARREPAPSHGC